VPEKSANHHEQAVDTLITRQEDLLITTQNIAELWNVATRPIANNGLALSAAEVAKKTTRPCRRGGRYRRSIRLLA
jgi:hypothetical protein